VVSEVSGRVEDVPENTGDAAGEEAATEGKAKAALSYRDSAHGIRNAAPPVGARLLLLVALVSWLFMRLPLFEQFAAQVHTDPSSVMASDLPIYLAVGEALLRHGRLGHYDENRVLPLGKLGDADFDMRTLAETAPPRWRLFDYNDWGYGVAVAAAWLVPFQKWSVYSVLVFQYLVDVLCLMLLCWIGARLVSPWAGACAALVYALHPALASVVNMPFYYFWSVAMTVFALALWVKLYGCGEAAAAVTATTTATAAAASTDVASSPAGPAGLPPLRWPTLLAVAASGLVLGLGTLVRATNAVLLPVFVALLFVRERISQRSVLLAGVLVLAGLLPLLPVMAIKYSYHGRIQVTGRDVFWHSVLCGLGLHSNPWGLQWKDEVVFERIRQKYGVTYRIETAREYDQACRKYMRSLKVPGFRQGKVPLHIITQRFGREIEQEAVEHVIQRAAAMAEAIVVDRVQRIDAHRHAPDPCRLERIDAVCGEPRPVRAHHHGRASPRSVLGDLLEVVPE